MWCRNQATLPSRLKRVRVIPHVAQLMALTLADQFVEERTAYYAQQDLDNRIEVKIRSRVIGYDHYQPKPLVNAIAGGALGLLLGLGLVLLLTWVESDLLRTPAALERALGVPVLGAIPSSGNPREAAQPVVSSSPMSCCQNRLHDLLCGGGLTFPAQPQ